MIRHTVTFKFKPTPSVEDITAFFMAAKQLANINGMQKFECLKQVGTKNNFDFGLSMEFETDELYDHYNSHPAHTSFVQQYWLPNVEDFIELDYKLL